MSNETPTLTASLRERTGSRYARRLRSAGKLPAVLYGQGSTLWSTLPHVFIGGEWVGGLATGAEGGANGAR